MATIPTPRTWLNGEQVTDAKMNTDVRDGFNFLLAPPHAQLGKSGTQSIPHNFHTSIAWDVEHLDTDGGHSNVTNNTRYTSQTAGWYYIVAQAETAISPAVGIRELFLRKNGNNATRQSRACDFIYETDASLLVTSGHIQLAVNDYVEIQVFQDSGAALNILSTCKVDIRWVRI